MELLEELNTKSVVLVVATPENYIDINTELLRYFCNKKKMKGIYVTVNKNYETMSTFFKSNNIDVDRVFFIDSTIRPGLLREKNCIYVGHPEDLTGISISISRVFSMISEESFLILDSITTMRSYNSPDKIAKFVHFLSAKLSGTKMKGIFLVQAVDQEIINKVASFVEGVIHSEKSSEKRA